MQPVKRNVTSNSAIVACTLYMASNKESFRTKRFAEVTGMVRNAIKQEVISDNAIRDVLEKLEIEYARNDLFSHNGHRIPKPEVIRKDRVRYLARAMDKILRALIHEVGADADKVYGTEAQRLMQHLMNGRELGDEDAVV